MLAQGELSVSFYFFVFHLASLYVHRVKNTACHQARRSHLYRQNSVNTFDTDVFELKNTLYLQHYFSVAKGRASEVVER